MMTDHRDQVEELLADYRRSREQLADVQRTLATVRESISSEDGAVTATIGAGGALTGLVIVDAAYRRYQPTELADLIVRTVQKAAAAAAESTNRALTPVLPAGADPDAVVAGTADLTPEEYAPPEPEAPAPRNRPRPDDSHDDDFEQRSWMDRSLEGRHR
jgi:DNA-binding protein YbaB